MDHHSIFHLIFCLGRLCMIFTCLKRNNCRLYICIFESRYSIQIWEYILCIDVWVRWNSESLNILKYVCIRSKGCNSLITTAITAEMYYNLFWRIWKIIAGGCFLGPFYWQISCIVGNEFFLNNHVC